MVETILLACNDTYSYLRVLVTSIPFTHQDHVMLTSFEVIPDHTITKHLGLINLFIIRETTALYEVRLSFITHLCHYCQPLIPL